MKIAILCVGNRLRGDDYLGILFGKYVAKKYENYKVFFGYDTPEDLFFDIQKYSPNILIIVDAALADIEIGANFVDDLADFTPTSTHAIPLNILAKYLKDFCENIIYLAIFVKAKNIMGINRKISKDGKKSLQLAINEFEKFHKIAF